MGGGTGGVVVAAAAVVDNETRRRVVIAWNLKDERWLNLELLSKVLTILGETLKKGDSRTSFAWVPIDGGAALFFYLRFFSVSYPKYSLICAVHMKCALNFRYMIKTKIASL